MSNSYIKMSPATVRGICQRALDGVKKERERRRKEYVEGVMQTANNGMFHKLFRFKDITYEQVVEYLDASTMEEKWYWKFEIDGVWIKNEEVAKDLLKASKATTDKMLISTEDYASISVF